MELFNIIIRIQNITIRILVQLYICYTSRNYII